MSGTASTGLRRQPQDGHFSPQPFLVGLAAADSDAQPVQCLRQAGGLDVLPSSLWWCSVTQLLLSWFCGGQGGRSRLRSEH